MTDETTERGAPDEPETIEAAFARAESEAEAAIKAATAVLSSLKRYRNAARQGKVRDLRAASETAVAGLRGVDARVADLAGSWTFDEEAYLANGGYAAELIDRAGDLKITELDGRLYCYPSLLRVLPADRAVQIDKAKERRLRPSVLIAHLKDQQRKPPRFSPAAFLEALAAAYTVALPQRQRAAGAVVPLADLYALLTMLPGQAKEYTTAEFARDIYLLDQSGQAMTKDGSHIEFHTGSGARAPRGAMTVVTQRGEEKHYHGVAFVTARGG